MEKCLKCNGALFASGGLVGVPMEEKEDYMKCEICRVEIISIYVEEVRHGTL